jgi:hypothetical protein
MVRNLDAERARFPVSRTSPSGVLADVPDGVEQSASLFRAPWPDPRHAARLERSGRRGLYAAPVTPRSARSWLVVLASGALLCLTSCSAATLSAIAPASGTAATSGPAAAPGSRAGDAPASSGHPLTRVHDPRRVTGTIQGHCAYRDGGQLPDPRCTPGSVDPTVTQGNIRLTICRPGYTKTVRPPASQTGRFKYDVAYPAYGTPQSKKTELDHLVSLELGGSNDATNLWPQSPPTPNPKDKVEDALHAAVCDGRVTLAAAQNAIASDWLTAEKKLGLSA